MYLMKLYFTIKKALPNRQCTSFHATGCHFTGPLALRPRLSSGLPNILLKLLNSSENIVIIILPYSTVRKQNHTVLMLLMLLKRRIIEIDQDSSFFLILRPNQPLLINLPHPIFKPDMQIHRARFLLYFFHPAMPEFGMRHLLTDLILNYAVFRFLMLLLPPIPIPQRDHLIVNRIFSGPCRNYASSMPRLPCNRASVLRPPGNSSISRRCRGCLTATDTASESAYDTAYNGHTRGGTDPSGLLYSEDASPRTR